MNKITYIADIDQDIDDFIAVLYLHKSGLLNEVVFDPEPISSEGIQRTQRDERTYALRGITQQDQYKAERNRSSPLLYAVAISLARIQARLPEKT